MKLQDYVSDYKDYYQEDMSIEEYVKHVFEEYFAGNEERMCESDIEGLIDYLTAKVNP